MFERLYRLFRPHFSDLALATVCMLLVSFSIGAQVVLIRYVLDELLIARRDDLLWVLPFGVVGFYSLQAVTEVGRGYFSRRAGQRVLMDLRNQVFAQIQRLSIDLLQQHSAGWWMARVTHDVEAVQKATTVFITLLQKPLTLAVLLFSAVWQSPGLTLLALASLPVVLVPIHFLGKHLRLVTEQSMDAMARINGRLHESIIGARVIRAFGMESYQNERFREESLCHYELGMKARLTTISSGPVVQVIASLGAAAIIWYGGRMVLDGHSSPGALVAFLVSLGLMYDPIKSLAKAPILLSQARVGVERVYEVLDAVPTVKERENARALKAETCELSLVDVSFQFDGRTVLKDVSFSVRPGQTLAIVGPSGAGKSTLLNLILRFYDPVQGSVLINGVDVRDLTLESLRAHVGIVTQDTFLFHDTILANIGSGRSGSSTERIEAVARIANAASFVETFQDGYQTVVGDLGQRLSGGERQRIAIARALLKDAPILLLDEATASLDQHSEAEVQRALEALVRDRTTVVVAHRLATIRNADHIVVLENGRIREEGSHEALIAGGGLYASMYRDQTSRRRGANIDT